MRIWPLLARELAALLARVIVWRGGVVSEGLNQVPRLEGEGGTAELAAFQDTRQFRTVGRNCCGLQGFRRSEGRCWLEKESERVLIVRLSHSKLFFFIVV